MFEHAESLTWNDIPSWQVIVDDWYARLETVEAPTFVLDLPVIASDVRSLFDMEKPKGTWIPVETLAKMRVGSWDKRETLLHGEPYAYRNPETDFPYVSAGASDAAKLLATYTDRTSFAAVMIGMSSIAAPQPSYYERGAIWRIGQLALAHVRTLGMDERRLSGMNRQSWLPRHVIEQDVETYGEAMAALAGEAFFVLERYRPVRLVPFLKTAKGFEPADPETIKQENDRFERAMGDATDSWLDKTTTPKRDWSARDTTFINSKDHDHYATALAFFERSVASAGFSPARYARLPHRVDLRIKAKGKTRIEVTLFRQTDICDLPEAETMLQILIGTDGSDPHDAAEQIIEFVQTYEEAIGRHQALLDKGIDPKAVHLDQIRLSPLTRRVLELAGITPGDQLTFDRRQHCDWQIIPWLRFDTFPYSIDFKVEDDILYFDEIDIPCPIHGGLTIRIPAPRNGDTPPPHILIPRPIPGASPGAPLHEVLSSPSLAGLPSISISEFHCYPNRTVITLDAHSPGMQPTDNASSLVSPAREAAS